MRSSILALVLMAFILNTTGVFAQATGQVTDVQISRITVRNGMMAVDVLHNGVYAAPEGPGLLTGWVNEFSAPCVPNDATFTVLVPVWRLPASPKPGDPLLTVTTHQAGINATFRRTFSAAEVRAILDRSK